MLLALSPLILALQLQQQPDMGRLNYDRRRTPVVEVVEAAAPAVVYIQTDGTRNIRDWLGRIRRERVNGAGSGVVILKEGFIVTNHHVVRNAKTIAVSFDPKYDDKAYEAQLVNYVEAEDLALLKIVGDGDFPTIPLGTSSDLMIGETVVAIGNPYGQTHTVHQGIISGLHRDVSIPNSRLSFDDLIQVDASINYGNSGGPLININGELIGINTAILPQAESIGFSIPVDRVRSVLRDQLLAPETAPTWLGFEVTGDNEIEVASVVPGSPAEAAGLCPGDRIIALAGQEVRNQDEYRVARLALTPRRGAVEVSVDRDGQPTKLFVPAWDKPDGILFERLGMTVEPVVYGRLGFNTTYLRVATVQEGGSAHELGLLAGDLIDAVRIRRETWGPRSREDLVLFIGRYPSGTQMELDILRDQNEDGKYQRDSEMFRGKMTIR